MKCLLDNALRACGKFYEDFSNSALKFEILRKFGFFVQLWDGFLSFFFEILAEMVRGIFCHLPAKDSYSNVLSLGDIAISSRSIRPPPPPQWARKPSIRGWTEQGRLVLVIFRYFMRYFIHISSSTVITL